MREDPEVLWTEVLRSQIRPPRLLNRLTVVEETDSTMDEARRIKARPGHVIVAIRQTRPRGRFGRTWHDPEHQGLALTVVLDFENPERLSLAAAVGVAQFLINVWIPDVSIKWPNDVMVGGKKIAGILLEQFNDCALIGIGMNVSQTSWPASLAGRAVSLRELDMDAEPTWLIPLLAANLNIAFSMSVKELTKEFARLDCLRGTVATFRSSGQVVQGLVKRVAPLRGLLIESAGRETWLPAHATTVLDDQLR